MIVILAKIYMSVENCKSKSQGNNNKSYFSISNEFYRLKKYFDAGTTEATDIKIWFYHHEVKDAATYFRK